MLVEVEKKTGDRQGVTLRATFPDVSTPPIVEGFDPLGLHVSYFLGDDPEQWYPDVPVWGGIRYVDLYPGFDLEISGSEGEWTWQLVPNRRSAAGARAFGSEAMSFRMRIEGAARLIADEASIRAVTDVGQVAIPLTDVRNSDGSPAPLNRQPARIRGNEVDISFLPEQGSIPGAEAASSDTWDDGVVARSDQPAGPCRLTSGFMRTQIRRIWPIHPVGSLSRRRSERTSCIHATADGLISTMRIRYPQANFCIWLRRTLRTSPASMSERM